MKQIIILLLFLTGCETDNQMETNPYKIITIEYTGYNKTFLDSLNALRADYGAQPLTAEVKLTSLAKGHATYMDAVNVISHDYFYARFIESQSTMFGETCAHNYQDVASEISAYQNSEGHFNCMINPNYKYVGIAKINGYQCVEFAKY